MKKSLLNIFSILLTAKMKFIFLAFVLLTINLSFGQQVIDGAITVNKTIVENPDECNQFDVTLEITGAAPDRPVEVMLVIDTSGSMGYSIPGDSNTPMYYAKQAALNFIQKILVDNNPTVLNKVGIVSYSSSASSPIQSLTNNKSTLDSKINSLGATGYTNIFAAF